MGNRVDNRLNSNEHVVEQISAYLDGALDDVVSDGVHAHIEECAACRAEYREVRATRHLLRAVTTVPPPRAFTLTPEMVGRKVWLWERLLVPRNVPRLATGSVLAFALVALLLIGDLAGGSYLGSMSPQLLKENADSAAAERTLEMRPEFNPKLDPPAEIMAGASETPPEEAGAPEPVAMATTMTFPTAMAQATSVMADISVAGTPVQGSPSGAGLRPQATSGWLENTPALTDGNGLSSPPATGVDSFSPQQSPDGGRVLLFSITGLLVALGSAFAVGAVFAARR